jgi:Putative MetA-pathway of phenol degradation
MLKPLLLIFLLFIVSSLIAQETGRMETDRPDQTESPFITKQKYIQTEIGFASAKLYGIKTLLHPTMLWKYGLSKRFELRLLTELGSVKTPLSIPDGNDFITGIFPVEVGGKLALWEEKGLLPKIAFLFHTAIPKAASKEFQLDKWASEFRFSMQHTLSENVSLGYNLGAEWIGFSSIPYWIYTLSSGFNLGKKGYAYIEVFGAVKNNEAPHHSFDSGFGYHINENVKLDISGGINIVNSADYIAAGCSFRFR